jgi:hypothetical protein
LKNTLQDLVPVLQTAIGPVILVSGIALLLLTMTNRIGRAIDRARSLHAELRVLAPDQRSPVLAQLRILSRRAAMLRRAITLGAVSVLLAALLVISLFVAALAGIDDARLVVALFAGCLLSLIGSLVEFLRDLNHSLSALRLELGSEFEHSRSAGRERT